MRRVLTYGTYDLLHWGHIRLLQRAKDLGDYLIVALSTDEFNALKPGKKPSYHSYDVRKMMLESIRFVDMVVPESSWSQKVRDVQNLEIDLVVMGSDWDGSPRFEHLREHCELAYLPRTEGTSTSQIRRDLLFEAIQYKAQAEAGEHGHKRQETARFAPIRDDRLRLPPPPRR